MMETTAKISVTTANNEWAVILAGGDGTRLKSLTRYIAGDERPKQFCSVMGGATLLEETQRRAALELAQERTLYVVNRAHDEVNFSHQVLALQPQRLAVLRVSGVRWNDLGEPKRVLASLNMAGIRPHWADAAMPQFA